MKEIIKKYLEAKLDDHQEFELKESLFNEDSVEGDMVRAFDEYKKTIKYPIKKEKRTKQYLLAASVSILILLSSVLYLMLSSGGTEHFLANWASMNSFDKLKLLHKINISDIDQDVVFGLYKDEKEVNVKMAMLRIMDFKNVSGSEFNELIKVEESQLVQSTLLGMDFKTN